MKPFQTQNLYELLEIDAAASHDEIHEAYHRARALYAEDSVAMYALEDSASAEALRARLTEAFDVLSNPDRRDEYDRGLGLPPRPTPVRNEAVVEEEAAPRQLAMTEMLQASAQVVHSTHPAYSVSYIPRTTSVRSGTLRAEPFRAEAVAVPETPVAMADGGRRAAPAQVEAPTPPPVAAPSPAPVAAPIPAPVAAPTPAPIPSQSSAGDRAGTEEPRLEVSEPDAPPRTLRAPTAQRDLETAPELAQQSAIASAEAAMAQVSARARESRPRSLDIPNDAVFNGELLRQVREARGMSLQQVADRTRIGKSHLENVEADRYASLPAAVYLRGILVSLARELGLDPVRVSKGYLSLAAGKTKER